MFIDLNDNGQKFPIKRYPNISKVFSIICFKFESTLGTLWENINQTQRAKKFNHLKLGLRCVRGANSSSINITLIDLDCSSFCFSAMCTLHVYLLFFNFVHQSTYRHFVYFRQLLLLSNITKERFQLSFKLLF